MNKSQDNQIIDGSNLKIGIIISESQWKIVEKLFNSALEILNENNVQAENIVVLKTPGIFELPLGCQKLATSNEFDALIVLGCSIKGLDDYYYFVTTEMTRAIMDISLINSLPIGYGIISAEEKKVAGKKSRQKNNEGWRAGESVLKMIKSL